MPTGADVFLRDGFAEIEFPDPAVRGTLIGRLLAVAKAEGARVRTDTGGLRKRYIVPEYIAANAGLIDGVDPDDDIADASTPTPEPEQVKADAGTPTPPPRPGHKGATKAAWTAYARAVGVPIDESMTISDIFAAVEAHTTEE